MIWKIVKRMVIIVFSLLIILTILLALPPVQTFIAKKASHELSERIGYEIKIGKVQFNPFNQSFLARNLTIKDLSGNKMVALRALKINLSLSSLLGLGDLTLYALELRDGAIAMNYDPDVQKLNFEDFIQKIEALTASSEPKDPNRKKSAFIIKRIVTDHMSFSFNDSRADSLYQGFDYNHFMLEELNADLKNFKANYDSISFQSIQLSTKEIRSGLTIKELSANFLYHDKGIEFDDLLLKVNNSVIRKKVILNYEDIKDLSDFIQKVNISADLQETRLQTKDLSLFTSDLNKYDDTWEVSGEFEGTLSNFMAQKLSLKLGEASHIEGDINMQGFPDYDNMLALIDVDQSYLLSTDLQQYVHDPKARQTLKKLNFISIEGNFDGLLEDFTVNTRIRSGLGNLEVNGQISPSLEGEKKYFQGQLKSHQFQLGKLIDAEEIGSVNLNGTIEGSGTSIENGEYNVNAVIDSISLHHYRYKNISVKGKIAKDLFNGTLISHDKNADFFIEGAVDLRKKEQEATRGIINIKGELKHLDLMATHFSKDTLECSMSFDINTKGLQVENIIGEAQINAINLKYKDKKIVIDSIMFSSVKQDQERTLDILSDIIDFQAKGDFTFQNIFEGLNTIYTEFALNVENQKDKIDRYYEAKKTDSTNYFDIRYQVHAKHINPILNLWENQIHITDGTEFKGYIKNKDYYELSLQTLHSIDSLVFENNKIYDINLNLTAYNSGMMGEEITAQLDMSSSRQIIEDFYTEDFIMNLIWIDNILDFRTEIKENSGEDYADLTGHIAFQDNLTTIEFDESKIHFIQKEWELSPHRSISIYKDSIFVDRVSLSHQAQQIIALGSLSKNNPDQVLSIDLENLNMDTFSFLAGKKLSGTLDGTVQLKDVYQNTKILGQINIEDFAMDGFPIGHISGTSSWNPDKNKFDIDFNIFGREDYILFVEGDYTPKSKNPLNLNIEMRETDMRLFEPFVSEYISELGGKLSGKLAINGDFSEPQIEGTVEVNHGRFKVNYLGARYELSDKIYFLTDEINFQKIELIDENRNRALFQGSIFHTGFKDIYLYLNGRFNNFQVLNTNLQDNSDFYGKAVVTGNLSINSPLDQMQVNISAKSEKGTAIYVPLDGFEKTSSTDAIEFVNFEKTKKDSTLSNIKNISIGGVKMDMELDVTEDAYIEIILDSRTKETIEGIGKGKIQMSVDTRGNFEMWGDYFITDGSYNFTMIDLIRKEFKVRKNSKIQFLGDLYSAELDIAASYDLRTSLEPLLNINNTGTNPNYSRRYPVSVLAYLTGPILAPDIRLDIDFNGSEKQIVDIDLKNAVTSFQSRIETDEQERNKQAFSLILFKKFSNDGSFNASGSGGNTLSEFISYQLSNWISQVDENLEIDLDLNTLDPNTTNVVQLTLSYTFLNGRLRVTRDGIFDPQNQNQTANIVGDWTVEYLLTKDGRYRLKMYNKSNLYNSTNASFTNNVSNAMSTGISILLTQTFDSLNELFHIRRKKKTKKQEKQ